MGCGEDGYCDAYTPCVDIYHSYDHIWDETSEFDQP